MLKKLEAIQREFNASAPGGKKVSLADLIVIAGNAAVEGAAKKAGYKDVVVPFTPGRVDATQEQTDVASYSAMEPTADGFRNWHLSTPTETRSPAEPLVDRASLLRLRCPSPPRSSAACASSTRTRAQRSTACSRRGPAHAEQRLLREPARHAHDVDDDGEPGVYEGRDRASNKPRFTASAVDLLFGSNAELRAVAEVYAQADGEERFVRELVKAWG